MKKIFKVISILLLVIMSITVLLYVRYLNLDTYTWDTDKGILTLGEKQCILTLGEKQYKCELVNNSIDLKLEKQIGKIEGEDFSFRVWSIKGESINEQIAIKGFMFPVDIYSRIK